LVPNESTLGDKKPFLILCVISAQFSKVYIVGNSIPDFFEKYAKHILGISWKKQIIILHQCDNFENYFVLSVNVKFNSIPDFNFDFGDTEGNARITTSLIPNYSKKFVGPVYLPLHVCWSNVKALELFRNKHREKTCITLAGTQSACFNLGDVVLWLNNNPGYIVIFMGYTTCEHDRVFILEDFIEFEDLIKFSDIWITNGGNGSVTIGLAFGIPQMCYWSSFIVGMDKYANEHQISQVLKVGPIRNIEFYLVMFDFIMNMEQYVTNAKKIQEKIQLENDAMVKNMSIFFQELATSESLQMELSNNYHRRRPHIPTRFLINT
jgi:UDP:flavonoid glycosyltransferase YjiC (YdhE family)